MDLLQGDIGSKTARFGRIKWYITLYGLGYKQILLNVILYTNFLSSCLLIGGTFASSFTHSVSNFIYYRFIFCNKLNVHIVVPTGRWNIRLGISSMRSWMLWLTNRPPTSLLPLPPPPFVYSHIGTSTWFPLYTRLWTFSVPIFSLFLWLIFAQFFILFVNNNLL